MDRQPMREPRSVLPGEESGVTGARRERRNRNHGSIMTRVTLASSEADLLAAYELVYLRYLKEGYQAPMPGKLRFIAHCCLPSSHTFVAKIQGQVVATLSLIVDRELGLPLEKEYAEEVAGLRRQGELLAEVSCLATRRFGDRGVLMRLMRAMYAFARYHLGITACCIAVHPSQRRFYERVLMFEAIGQQREYEACGQAPAIAMRMALTDCEQRMARLHADGLVGRFFSGDCDYARMAAELAGSEPDALRARYAFSRYQLLRHPVSEQEQDAIVSAYRVCFGLQDVQAAHF
jgi:hypothetical protein